MIGEAAICIKAAAQFASSNIDATDKTYAKSSRPTVRNYK